MESRILNAISRTELIDLQKEVDRTAYTDEDSERFTQMIEEQLENFK